MRALLLLALGWRSLALAEEPAPLVDIHAIAPSLRVDLRYAGTNNVLHQAVYPSAVCLLRRPVALRLAAVERELAAQGKGLLLWDCYRPRSIQQRLWALQPDPRYVADPKRGSRHNRGAAVDLTLVGGDGLPLEMPTDFDDAGARAHRDAAASPAAIAHRALLEAVMTRQGFLPLRSEWWHFDDLKWRSFPLAAEPPAQNR